jgi:hypothetical protein
MPPRGERYRRVGVSLNGSTSPAAHQSASEQEDPSTRESLSAGRDSTCCTCSHTLLGVVLQGGCGEGNDQVAPPLLALLHSYLTGGFVAVLHRERTTQKAHVNDHGNENLEGSHQNRETKGKEGFQQELYARSKDRK